MKLLFKYNIVLIFLVIINGFNLYATEIKICTDLNFWYPFTYAENGISKGVHVDVVTEACRQLNWKCKFEPLPWKRCLEVNAKNGIVDAVVSASYKDKRAKYLFYPKGAKSDTYSEWRISQVEYVVVTHLSNPYTFTGDIKTIPHPIRAEYGYSIIDDFNKKGIKVVAFRGAKEMLSSLLKKKSGSLITIPNNIMYIAGTTGLNNKIKIHKKQIKSKSYFMSFSKKTKISKAKIQTMWDKIKDIRNDKELFKKIFSKY